MAQLSDAGIVSPDRRHIAVLTIRGRIEPNATEGTLWLFDYTAVRQALAGIHPAPVEPEVLARVSASFNGGSGASPAIVSRIRWARDGASLFFVGCDGSENHRLFRVGLRDGTLHALSRPDQDVVDYDVSGEHVAYLAGPGVLPERAWWANDPQAPDIVEGGRSLWETLFPDYQKNARYMPTELEVWRGGAVPEPVRDAATGEPMRLLGSYNLSAFSLSHDGSKLVAIAHVDRVPHVWETYEVPRGLDFWGYRGTPEGAAVPLGLRENDYAWPLQYQIIDLQKGTRRALLDSPAADYQRDLVDRLQAAWSPDDRAVAITGTFLPLASVGKSAKRPCGVAVVELEDGRTVCLISHADANAKPVTGVTWAGDGDVLRIESEGSEMAEYTGRDLRWRRSVMRPHAGLEALTLSVQQDLNHPPVLVARAARSGKSLVVFDPNPQLQKVALGDVSVYQWKTPRGLSATGGLAKPPDFQPGRRYPLVIQTHGFPQDQFFRVGYGSETANAGRALAARGMLVLQVGEPHSPDDATWREATERGTEVYLAAVDQLAAEGLVDPARVGLTGYSRAGGFVAKAITEAPDRFAAAAVVNTDVGSQFGYYTYIDYGFPGNARRIADFFAGARPYGAGLQRWLERSPGFNTDKIRAPVLVSAGDPQHLLVLWNLYAALVDQHKPVELQYIRNGQHNLIRPQEVLAHQEKLVDWFDFWLNSHEDAQDGKSDQYERWRKMRESMRGADADGSKTPAPARSE